MTPPLGRAGARDWATVHWFGGSAFSAADLALFMAVLFARRLHGPSLDDFPALAAWFARAGARSSVRAG